MPRIGLNNVEFYYEEYGDGNLSREGVLAGWGLCYKDKAREWSGFNVDLKGGFAC